jgi:hypothetical protein
MDFFQLISDLGKADPEFMDRINPRRRVFQHLGNTGKKITAAAAPAILASFFTKAYGQTTTLPQPVIDVLNLALGLEYLEYYFYDTALNISGLIPSAETQAVQIIRNDEAGHINTIRGVLGASAIPDPTRASFDYSGGSGSMQGPMAAALTVGATNPNGVYFFGAAQAFSDTGQRAYKGGAPVLNTASTKDILEAALNIHSVEARHNSHFRTVRRAIAANTLGSAAAPAVSPFDVAPKSWISGRDNNGPPAPNGSKPAAAVYGPGNPATGTVTASAGADTVYPAEDNTTQASVNLLTGIGTTPYTAAQVSEAFDEPLDPTTVKTIARMFTTPAGLALGLFK